MPLARYDSLVSPGALDRWRRWSHDLRIAERKEREADAARYGVSPPPPEPEQNPHRVRAAQEKRRKNHTSGLSEALVNDAQPATPPASDDREILFQSSSPSRASSSVSIAQFDPDVEQGFIDPDGPPGPLAGSFGSPPDDSVQNLERRPRWARPNLTATRMEATKRSWKSRVTTECLGGSRTTRT
jgi:taspase (threonine aspartase 1)